MITKFRRNGANNCLFAILINWTHSHTSPRLTILINLSKNLSLSWSKNDKLKSYWIKKWKKSKINTKCRSNSFKIRCKEVKEVISADIMVIEAVMVTLSQPNITAKEVNRVAAAITLTISTTKEWISREAEIKVAKEINNSIEILSIQSTKTTKVFMTTTIKVAWFSSRARDPSLIKCIPIKTWTIKVLYLETMLWLKTMAPIT